MKTHPDLPREQSYLTRSYSLLEKKLADAEVELHAYQPGDRHTARALQRVDDILQKEKHGDGPLIFGRMDDDEGPLYVGRRRVYDENRDPVVISWHAPAAQRYYDAGPDDPRGLSLKRVFQERDRRLIRLIDEIVRSGPGDVSSAGDGLPVVSDALLAELERYREGAMRDVVATIQAEQHRVMREPADGVLVVQGGPGTGKTVVGLHRAAWLAFNREDVRAAGMLIVAPTVPFLNYVAGVLPSLNAGDLVQIDLGSLYLGEARSQAPERDPDTARVKGGPEMALVLLRALERRRGWDGSDLTLTMGATRFLVSAASIQQVVDEVSVRRLPHNEARDVLRTRFAEACFTAYKQYQADSGRAVMATLTTVLRLNGFTNALDRMWPTFTPEAFVRLLYGTQDLLTRATDGILSPDDRARLFRPAAAAIGDEPWTDEDIVVLDEAAALLNGVGVSYGHAVVDEAQDLSPMQARALARRCPKGSVTLLGDLSQATGVWVRDDWSELTGHFGAPSRTATLSIGYRVPRAVLALAGRQLPLISPGLAAPASIREGLGEPTVVRADAADLVAEAVRAAEIAAAGGLKTALIVPDHRYEETTARCRQRGTAVGDGRDGDFSAQITVLPAGLCKGLEFNAVVLMAPDEITAGSTRGRRLLYVAMTRCTQALTLVHAARLPAGLDHLDTTPVAEPAGQVAPEPAITPDLAALVARLTPADSLLVEQLVRRLLEAS
jgi:DNA helicase IV